jgi:hypothetical protein
MPQEPQEGGGATGVTVARTVGPGELVGVAVAVAVRVAPPWAATAGGERAARREASSREARRRRRCTFPGNAPPGRR